MHRCEYCSGFAITVDVPHHKPFTTNRVKAIQTKQQKAFLYQSFLQDIIKLK